MSTEKMSLPGLSREASRNIFLLMSGLSVLWIFVASARSMSRWFEPVGEGQMKMDALDEIYLTATALNYAVPIGIVALGLSIFFSDSWAALLKPFLPLLIFFLLGTSFTMVWFRFMDRAHGSDISLFQDWLWWR